MKLKLCPCNTGRRVNQFKDMCDMCMFGPDGDAGFKD